MLRLSFLQSSEDEDGAVPVRSRNDLENDDAKEAKEFKDGLEARGKRGPHRVSGVNTREWVRALFTPFDSRDPENLD